MHNNASFNAFYATRQRLPVASKEGGEAHFRIALLLAICLTMVPGAFAGDSSETAPPAAKKPKILLDTPRDAPPPPMESVDSLNDDFKAARDQRRSKEEKRLGSPEERQQKKVEATKNAKIVEQILEDKPLALQLAASLVVPHITTSGKQRKNYTAEPTAHLHFYLRPGARKAGDNVNFWTGFRYAPFVGSATYQNIPGRYGFSYFGPMFGLGALTSAPRSLSKELTESPGGPGAFHRYGYFLMGGIAAQSRQAGLDKGVSHPSKELNTKGVAFDAPGFWLEYTVVSMDYNAVSYHCTLGVQTGEAKAFFYVGLGTGFWY